MIDPFKYVMPKEEMKPLFTNVADSISSTYHVIIANVPPCADRTLALRKLQECRMWANAAISFEGRDELKNALEEE